MANPLKDDVIGNLLAQYPLSEPRTTGLLEASNRNENLIIQDSGENKYVLRRYRRNNDAGRILFQLKVQQHLLDNAFPTSEIINTLSGERILKSDEDLWALFTFVEGTEYNFSRLEQAREAGQKLAQFHNILKSFPEKPVYLDFNLPLRDVCVNSENNLAQLEEMFRNQNVDEELSSCRRWWEWTLDSLPLYRLDELPSGWIHRDYHGRNMVFVGDQMKGLFDFDVLTEGPFAFDIAYGMHAFGREFRGSRTVRQEFAQSFLDGYSNVRPIIREEMEAIPLLFLFTLLPEAAYYVYRKRDGDDIREMFIKDLRTLPDVEVESAQLRSIVTEI